MGIVQKDSLRTMLISYLGLLLGYINKAFLFLLILSTEQIGVVNLIFSLGILFAQLSNFGMVYSVWKFFPFFYNKEKKHHGFLPFSISIVLIGVILMTFIALWFRSDIESIYLEKSQLFTNYYFWLIPLGIAYVFYLVLEVYLRSLLKNIVSVFAMELVLRLAVTSILLLLWFKCITFDDFVVLHSLVYFIPVIILLVYMYRIDELHLGLSNFNISKKFRRIIFQFSSFNYINTLGSTLVISLDVIMIASYLGLQATGVYTTVVFLTSALQVPYKAIVRISSPLIADHWKKREMEKMKELYTQVSSVALVIGLGSFLLIWSNIDFLFSFLKPEFKAGIWVFFFLMIGRLTDMYFGLNGAIFTTSKKYKYDMIFTLFLIGTVYGLNLLFIPAYGISGAAISTSIALVCYNLGRLLFVYKVYKIHPFTKGQFLIIALGLLTFFLCHYLQNIFQDLWIQMLFMSSFVAILFFGSIYFFKLEKETVNYVNNSMDFLIKKIRRKN